MIPVFRKDSDYGVDGMLRFARDLISNLPWKVTQCQSNSIVTKESHIAPVQM